MRKRHNILLVFMLFGLIPFARSQEMRTEFSVNFRTGSAAVEPSLAKNAEQISALTDFLNQATRDESIEIRSIVFCGTTSLEGSYQFNRKLAQQRLSALEQLVRSRVTLPEHLISHNDRYIPWEDLKAWVRASELSQKEAIIAIIDSDARMVPYADGATIDERVLKLKNLDDGLAWYQLSNLYFSNLRSASAVIVTLRKAEPAPVEAAAEPAPAPVQTVVETAPEPPAAPVVPEPDPEPVPAERYTPHLYLKTNLVGWGLSMVNAAVEADLCSHLSFTLPIYYSGADYLFRNLKFRIFGFQPELRYWFRSQNDGWFVGGHYGMAWYNFAFMGQYRYQDHHRETPAIGGGVSVGYRLPVSRNRRWKMEFSVGGGAYEVHYDRFRNERRGTLVDSRRKTYIGVDNVSIAIGYTFDLKKGGAQ